MVLVVCLRLHYVVLHLVVVLWSSLDDETKFIGRVRARIHDRLEHEYVCVCVCALALALASIVVCVCV